MTGAPWRRMWFLYLQPSIGQFLSWPHSILRWPPFKQRKQFFCFLEDSVIATILFVSATVSWCRSLCSRFFRVRFILPIVKVNKSWKSWLEAPALLPPTLAEAHGKLRSKLLDNWHNIPIETRSRCSSTCTHTPPRILALNFCSAL